ncbi:MAG: DASS family sodium-coupled anion symporter [Deltaproteobacteria bacterium]|nr:DASS family sodium-coupled anion symporter [Deltaproteobacteria bacterium]
MGTRIQKIGLILGPAIFLIMLFFDLEPGNPAVTRMAAVTLLMAVWWITDAIPLAATAILPMVLFPLLGILKGTATAPVYVNSTIFLFIGGFMIALAIEKWNLHKRIALLIIRFIGGGPQRILLGFMIAAGFLSMWISNTATAIMMLPIGMAIVSQMEDEFGEKKTRPFTVALMLGIAYACSTGGIATLVGTPPNLVLQRVFELTFPEAPPLTFGQWFLMGLPLSILMGSTVWLLLAKIFFRLPRELSVNQDIVEEEYGRLGAVSYEEKVVSIAFACTALLWIFRKKLVLGFATIPGWSGLLPFPEMIDDGTVALFMATILFFIPAEGGRARIIDASIFQKLPWGVVVLFGGGFALAKGFQITGLSSLIGNKIIGLSDMHPIVMIVIICLMLTFLTELTSNTATSQMILPIMASVAAAMKINPLILMIPATISCSCAFMLPAATPPNAIVFGSKRIKIIEMARVGVFINLICAPIITLFFYYLGTLIMNIQLNSFPEWAVFV